MGLQKCLQNHFHTRIQTCRFPRNPLSDFVHHQTFALRPGILSFIISDLKRLYSNPLAQSPGKISYGIILSCSKVECLPPRVLFADQLHHALAKILYGHDLPALMPITPKYRRRPCPLRVQDLTGQIVDKMHLTTILMIIISAKRRGN